MKRISIILSAFILCLIMPFTVVNAQNQKVSNQQLKTIIKKMSLQQKIAQMYIISTQANQQNTAAAIQKEQPGGIILFGNDFKDQTKQQFVNNLNNYQKQVKLPLLIGTDQEGGSVSRLSANPELTGNRNFPSPQQSYQTGGQQGVAAEAAAVAEILHSLQINLNFAPVADVSNNQQSFIYSRTLGLSYRQTAAVIKAEIPAMQKNHVAASLKHFPGYGSAGDTHTGFATNDKSLKEFEKNDFVPFKAGIQAGAQVVLVSHIFANAIDAKYPASLSPKIHRILRQKLHFKGVIITDDLTMGAITKFATEKHVSADVLAVKAGNDLLLSNDLPTGLPAIVQAVKKHQIRESQINDSVYRILKLKRDLGILNPQNIKIYQNN